MKSTIFLLFGFSALLPITLAQRLIPFRSPSSLGIGQYNAPCVTSNQCDQKKGLYCVPPSAGSQPRCRCPTNTTVYDESMERCVGKINENCAYQANTTYCPQNAHCSHQDPRNPSLYFYESKCFCDPNYIPNDKGNCVPAAKFNEPCNETDKKCDILAGLKCDADSKTCICEFDTDQFYDKEKGKCVSFINKKCSTYYGCVENARCEGLAPAKSRTFVGPRQSRKPAGSDSATINQSPKPKQVVSAEGRQIGKCTCEYGFSASNNGRCMASYRTVCSVLSPCNPLENLECQDGTCNCKNPLHMFWSHTDHKCRVLVNGKCTGKPPGNSQECTDNAVCDNGICVCEKGFSKTPHRKCLKSYLQPCENESCNSYSGLMCNSLQQKCTCFDDSTTYNPQLQACVSKKDMPCGRIGQAADYGHKEQYYVNCEPPMQCKAEVDGDLSTSYCKL